MTDDRLWRTAVHEAAHATVSVLFGHDVDVLSIRPGAAHDGVTLGGVPHEKRLDLDALLAPEVLHSDPRARAQLEGMIVGILAGDQAARNAAPRAESRYWAGPPEAVRAATALASLSPRHREILAASEADPVAVTDDERALIVSRRLAGAEAGAHVEWLRQVARRLVYDHSAVIEAVAEALMERELLSGAEIVALVRGGADGAEAAA